MLIRVASRLARRLPRLVAADWTTMAAVALAVVLTHSAWQHFAPSQDLQAYYLQRLGDVRWTRIAGAAQLALALGLSFRRTRATACAMLVGVVTVALVGRVLAGQPGDGWTPSIAVIAAAIAIAAGEIRSARRAGSQAEYSREPDG